MARVRLTGNEAPAHIEAPADDRPRPPDDPFVTAEPAPEPEPPPKQRTAPASVSVPGETPTFVLLITPLVLSKRQGCESGTYGTLAVETVTDKPRTNVLPCASLEIVDEGVMATLPSGKWLFVPHANVACVSG